MTEIDPELQLLRLRTRWPIGSEVRHGTRIGVVDGVTVVRGIPAVYVAWLPLRQKGSCALVIARQLVKVSA